MSKRTLAIIILIPFTVLTAYAVQKVGYIGIFDYHRHSPAGWQVIADLVIALVLVLTSLAGPEARRAGRNPWPWVVATLFLGSFGPLLYLVFRAAPRFAITGCAARNPCAAAPAGVPCAIAGPSADMIVTPARRIPRFSSAFERPCTTFPCPRGWNPSAPGRPSNRPCPRPPSPTSPHRPVPGFPSSHPGARRY